MMELLIVTETWKHMASTSGLVPLFMSLERHPSLKVTRVEVPQAIPTRSLPEKMVSFFNGNHRTSISPSSFAGIRHEIAIKRAVSIARKNPNIKILLSAAENQLCGELMSCPANIRSRVFAIFHQPASWMKLNWRDYKALDGLGGIFCLGTKQADFFRTVTSTRVVTIRHGVDLTFFRPEETEKYIDKPRILFVGDWLRDFETLHSAMRSVWMHIPKMELDCVVPWKGRGSESIMKLATDPRMNLYADISPENLRSLYWNAFVLFLPLLDAVANNAIAEAQACGLPVIATKIGDTNDYVCPEVCSLCSPFDVESHVQPILDLLLRNRSNKETDIIRSFATSALSWDETSYEIVRSIYDPLT